MGIFKKQEMVIQRINVVNGNASLLKYTPTMSVSSG